MQSPSPVILGIDPGYAIMGYGAVSESGSSLRAIAYGVVTTPATLAFPDRLLQLHRELTRLIGELRPAAVAIERLYFAKNTKTALDVSQARGVILLTCMQHGLPVHEYTPMQVKQAVCGHGGADKRQVQKMVQLLLRLDTIPHPDDAADALAIAIAGLRPGR